MRAFLIYKCLPIVIVVILFLQCEMSEICASCVDPDFTVFVFDTTANGFSPNEIDSFYIIRFPRGELDTPLDTTELFIRLNPFILSGGLFSTSTLSSDYIVESINQEFRFEITDLDYTIRNIDDDCRCDVAENKSLRINGDLIFVPDPFEPVMLQK